MGIPDHLTCLLRNLYAGQEATVRTGHGTTDWFQIAKEYVKAVYCHPAYLTYMQSTSCKMPGCMNIDVTILEQANRTWQCNKSIVHMSSSEGGVPYLLCLKL